MPKTLIIAVDGPAASGKGTIAKRIAAAYDLAHLDTGLLYRAVGAGVLAAGDDPADEAAALAAVKRITPEALADPALRDPEIGKAASVVAAIAAVRAALLDYQRGFAHHPPGGKAGAVLDGRDIGTVVCPDADVKFYVDAAPETRARRRFLELKAGGSALSEAQVLADIKERDARDAGRETAPLTIAPGAYLLDTTDLSIEAAFAAVRAFIDGQQD